MYRVRWALAPLLAFSLQAQNINPPHQPGYAEIIRMPIPVVARDITDRPYRVIGEIHTNVSKATIFSADPSERKVFEELWQRARKVGADAVVNARYSESVPGGWTWGRRKAHGQAIKFLTAAEIAKMRR